MPLWEISLVTFTALFAMVNPLSVVPSFVAMTGNMTKGTRARVALIAGLATTVVLTIFLFFGNVVFKFFGITLPAFQIMGGVYFFASSVMSLLEDESRPETTRSNRAPDEKMVEAAESHDPFSVAVVPLAIPLLSGPGAITTVMLLVALHKTIEARLAVLGGVAAIGVASYLVLLAALPISRFIGARGRVVFDKVMGLLVGAIGIQFIIDGVRPLAKEMLSGLK
ncbi:MAG: MarC family protein [Thermoanaerobaculia bacterium]